MEPTHRKTLYARPLVAAYSGDGSKVTDIDFTNANTSDNGKFSAYATSSDGRGLGFTLGFGRIFMNGAFSSAGSLDFVTNGGWLGDYKNPSFNTMIGALRQLNIMINYCMRREWGPNMLVITDEGSTSNTSNLEHWGQLVKYLRHEDPDLVTTTVNDLKSGHLGYRAGNHIAFKPFSCIIFLLSNRSDTIGEQLGRDLGDIIKKGQGYVCLQMTQGRGFQNHNRIFKPLGIQCAGGSLAVTTRQAADHAKSKFGDHIVWSTVKELHYSHAVTTTDDYSFTPVSGKPTLNGMKGQPGTWTPVLEYEMEVTDDYTIEPPILIKDQCCYRVGDVYDITFDVPIFPYKPDDWQQRLAEGTHSLTWTERNANSVEGLKSCDVYARVIGYQRYIDHGTTGITRIAGQEYGNSRGLNCYLISKENQQLVERRTFDLHAGGEGSADGVANATAMANYLNSKGGENWILIVSFDECKYNHLAGGLPAAMKRCGASSAVFESPHFVYRAAYMLFGTPGLGEGTAECERYLGLSDSDVESWFEFGMNFDTFHGHPILVGVHSDNHPWYDFGIKGYKENKRIATFRYRRQLGELDRRAIYGREFDIAFKDERFHKLPMYINKDIAVSVQNPCMVLQNYPRPSINDTAIVEGDSGTKWVTFTITLDVPVEGRPLEMDISTHDGTARALSNETSVKWVATDPNGVPTMSYLDFEKTRVVFDAGFPKYYNSAFNADWHNNIQKFTKNAMAWLNRGRNDKILITGDVYPGNPSGASSYSIKGTGGSDFGVALPSYLRSLGYQVDIQGWDEMYGGAPSALIFDQYSVVIFISSVWGSMEDPPLGISFSRSLENSVRRGTGLMVITDHSSGTHGFAASANRICERFYANFSGSYDRTELNIDSMIAQGINHPLISGMSGKMKAFGSEGRIDSTGLVGDPQDYIPKSERLVFNIGEQTKTFTVQVRGDHLVEGDEYFKVRLDNISRWQEEPRYIKQEGRCEISDDDGTPFGSNASAGGHGVEWKQQLYKNNTGVFILWSEHYTVPDRVDIFRDKGWLDSRPRGGQAPYDFPTGSVITSLASSGGQHEICIPHYAELGYTTYYDVRMQGTGSGTAWDYKTSEQLPRDMHGSHQLGPFVHHINMHDTRRAGRDTPFIIRVTYSGSGTIQLRRVGQVYVSGSGSGVYEMAHDPSADFAYIEVASSGTGNYTIQVV